MSCPKCGSELARTGRFCPDCGENLSVSDDRTVLAGASGTPTSESDVDRTRLASTVVTPIKPVSRPASGGGWLSASGSIDHGRFDPGAIVDGRYRVIGLLGKGGMGEVYRADDLRLGQPVALKFLPDGLHQDPNRLAQFHNEVRIARQVSHPSVCRVHDIGEVDGHIYLSMEYVDGEDLATSLRRIGRFSEDRALEISRQICAGLAAAHARGVLHRDLKPANVMLDGAGRVRLMDFGLASAGAVGDVRAGTPAYMAPEQLQGREVSEKSDIYALGLVMYELFTGRRAINAGSLADLMALHETGSITRPGEIVKTIDPVVERAIVLCLDREPARRPASALAVSAMLPGGDPLAAALAAGETPSPAMVAAAGGEAATLGPAFGAGLSLASVLGVILAAWLASQVQLVSIVDMALHPRTLEDRARQLEARVGLPADPRDEEIGLFANVDILGWLWSRPDAERRALVDAGWPPPVLFWHRTSPRLLFPADPGRIRPTRGDPPMSLSGMSITALGADGRLIEFQRVPDQTEAGRDAAAKPVDWSVFFDAAGLDFGRFAPATPEWTPRFFADDRLAWVETTPGPIGVPLRVEAASHRGTPVSFQIVGPWARPTREQAAPVDRNAQIIGILSSVIIVPVVITAGVVLARRNLRLGRGDRRGAIFLATIVFSLSMITWLLGARHFGALLEEQTRFGSALAAALFAASIYGLLYLAVEPTVRRVWPQILITWSRLAGGRLRDPLLGRDLVVGTAAGLLSTIITFAHYGLPSWFGVPAFRPAPVHMDSLLGLGPFLAGLIVPLRVGFENAILGSVGLVLVRMLVKKPWATFAVASILFAPLAAQGQFQTGFVLLDLGLGVLLVAIVVGVILKYGLVAGVVSFFVHLSTKDLPLTLESARPYFTGSLIVIAVVVAAVVAGFVMARANQPMLGRLAEDT